MATLHLLGLFHTVPSPSFSHCAFTGRVYRFGKMMMPYGWDVIEYSNEGSESQATEHVTMLTKEEFEPLQAKMKASPPHGEASTDSDIYRAFCAKLNPELIKRVKPGDIVCHPFGHTHGYLDQMLPYAHHIEVGVGYPDCYFPLRVYETYQWWSWHQGKENKAGNSYQWVCPMGYDIDEWEPSYEEGKYLLYFGRVIECKGLYTIKEIAKHTDMQVIMCGSGTPEQFLDPEIPNLIYKEPVTGLARSELLRNAYALLMPTQYCEPFGGAGVEGQLCGTPLIASDFGAFSETVQHGYSGFRCKTLGDYMAAVRNAKNLNRRAIASTARAKYSLQNVGQQMDRIFKQVEGLDSKGWYSLDPTDAIWS
jgi:glycosyltransferase involved in cell wall biosynthesis